MLVVCLFLGWLSLLLLDCCLIVVVFVVCLFVCLFGGLVVCLFGCHLTAAIAAGSGVVAAERIFNKHRANALFRQLTRQRQEYDNYNQ